MKVPGFDLEGFAEIGPVVGVGPKVAARLARRAERPLPVRRYLRFIIARRAELEAWLEAERRDPLGGLEPRPSPSMKRASKRLSRQHSRLRRARSALGRRFDVFGLDAISVLLGCSRERAAVLARRAERHAPAFVHRGAWVAVRAELEAWLAEERRPAGELRGWRAIGDALSMSAATVPGLAARAFDPLPARRTTRAARVGFVAHLEELLAWKAREDERRLVQAEPDGLVVGLMAIAAFCDMSPPTVLAHAKRAHDPLPYQPGPPGSPSTSPRAELLAWLEREGRRRSGSAGHNGLVRGRWAEHQLPRDVPEGEELVGWAAICAFSRVSQARARAAMRDEVTPFPAVLEVREGRVRPVATKRAIASWLERTELARGRP
ncbi:MAG: hypothetical protein K1X94_03295 [Sandaracinaceae bacterium]|nr:hypothetical protein [Sandaracinaceae bacterium]